MKFTLFALFVIAFVALAHGAPADELEVPTGVVVTATESSEAIELFGAGASRSRQRICTIQLCRAVCGSLGFRWARCTPQRICQCRN
ncbi:unnamed protein product [Leptosia nina]|uniref:Defensin n=1 Tax=Leptosia nina TaxID=320188 RepID=A0AAV1JU12_9NEOP